ncbi:2-ketoisovalerate ferredoxin oxidoreductase [candidate division KSB1 bacterium]|nr:MAG: 2-ketoisovalerate ferredoxin oxidoreductase [candidate division KSB1 bacterium]RKY78099.1 MAG: 2-ketoisovalerate ferredoxin oxidoreductase [candidate division KSB1 bacterium]RKY89248.1 MAG: 2-ketoisovalerate ferredoxin oxidoreductase [candidate division KSB1 bacterium]
MANKVLKKADSFYPVYERKPGANKNSTHYCPGCGHGVLHKLIAEAIDDFGIRDRTIFISPVGCSVFAYYYFRTGNIQVAHGRAPAVATGFKRAHPESIVISYQGDGDLAAIGGNNILQAANRGEHITVFFVNNGIYGMTGGQMAPTTLIGQKTTTSPHGRSVLNEGYPIRIAELLATLESPVYIERVALTDAKNTARARKAVRKALMNQIQGKGFSLVEVLSACPSGWKMTPVQAKKWITENMVQYFPLGVFRDRSDEIEPQKIEKREFSTENIKQFLNIPTEESEQIELEPSPERYHNPRLKIAGFGGQGILLLGVSLAEVGMRCGYHVSWLPSYGPEMRGGTANCHVNLSDTRIGSPLVSRPTVLIAMNLPSLDKFESEVETGGLIIYDSELINRKPERNDVEILAIPATKMADELGNTRVANMIILGAYIAYTDVLSKDIVRKTLPSVIKRKDLISLNEKAIELGYKYGEKLRNYSN